MLANLHAAFQLVNILRKKQEQIKTELLKFTRPLALLQPKQTLLILIILSILLWS